MSTLFSPYTLRGPDAELVLPNRIVVAPMCQ
jgi:2,4-dienoyl-CoA reductase-like NADH-dependent reductase (Old Yellow Enzyme family)